MEEAVAAIAAHLGIVNEDEINNMSIPFFNDVLAALGKRLNFESISNIYGNSFAKDSSKYVNDAFPLIKKKKKNGIVDTIKNLTIIKQKAPAEGQKTDGKEATPPPMFGGMVSWANDAFSVGSAAGMSFGTGNGTGTNNGKKE